MSRRLWIVLTCLVIIVAGGALLVGFSGSMSADKTCNNQTGHDFRITIRSSSVSLPKITGHLCDAITFTNQDTIAREIAFGPHEDHVAYDGVAERVLTKNQSFTITLNQPGSFQWHDHLHDEVHGTFTVAK